MFKVLKLSVCHSTTVINKLPVSSCFFILKRFANSAQINEAATDDILEDLCPTGAPVYTRVPEFIKQAQVRLKNDKKDKKNMEKNVVISCKNRKLNHYKNQKYDNKDDVILASKGWHHYKSKGDYFMIKVCDDKDYIENLFWDEDKTDFSNFKLNPSLVEALKEFNFTAPTKIQAKAIPKLLSGWNSLITAETGCGKTLAYLIPVFNQLLGWTKHLPAEREFNSPLALVLTPSRDLAEQIGNVASKLSYLLPLRCNVLVGGRTKKKMLNPEYEQTDLLIATPGAFSKLVTTGIYNVSHVKHVVLDEGDTMLDDSFNQVLVRLLRKIKIRYQPSPQTQVPGNSQFTIVSATMPRSIYNILDDIVETDSLHKISTDRTHQILPHVCQTFYRLGLSQKVDKVLSLVKESVENDENVMIFSNKTSTCDWLSMMLNENGIKTAQLNGNMPEMLRQGKFREFNEGKVNVLSCTDIASRGLDTVNVRHIINYDFPRFMADYVHRCGRTGRVGSHVKCRVSNFVTTGSDINLVQEIERAVRCMNELPNVNGNISKIIHYRYMKFMEKNTGKSL